MNRRRIARRDPFRYFEVLEQEVGANVWQINSPQYRLEAVGSTFDGRDLFAPAAAWLSKGVPPTFLGPVVQDPIRWSVAIPVRHEELLVGKIISVDRFGNLISNITARQVREFRAAMGQAVEIHIGTHVIKELVGSYSQGSRQAPSALINSSGNLEIFLQEASATQHLQVGVGEEVHLC